MDLGNHNKSVAMLAFLFNPPQPLMTCKHTKQMFLMSAKDAHIGGWGEDEGLHRGCMQQGEVVQWYWGCLCWRHPARVLQQHFCSCSMIGGREQQEAAELKVREVQGTIRW